MPLWSPAACKGNILFTEIPCNYTLGCFRSMIKELTELHQRKCTNHHLKIKISLAAASHIIISMSLQKWIKGIFEIPGGIHALLDVRVQLVMSEPACVFRQGSVGLKNCVLTSESMHETLSTTEGLWAWRVMATQSYRHPNQPCYSSAAERKWSSQHTIKLLFGFSYQGGVCVYWLCAEGEGCTGDWGRQVESLGNLPPQFLVNNLDQTALLSH